MPLKPASPSSSRCWTILKLWDRLFARSLRGLWRRDVLQPPDAPRSLAAYQKSFYREEIIDITSRFSPGDDTLLPDPDQYSIAYLPQVHGLCRILAASLPRVDERFEEVKAERKAQGERFSINKGNILHDITPLSTICAQIVADGPRRTRSISSRLPCPAYVTVCAGTWHCTTCSPRMR